MGGVGGGERVYEMCRKALKVNTLRTNLVTAGADH